MNELKELHELLKEKYKSVIWEDLYLFDGYLICEQKKITWENSKFLITCLFNSHQDLYFSNKEEILKFFQLLWVKYNFNY